MAQAAPARTKIPTETPQLLHSGPARRAGRPKKGNRTALSWVITSGTGRATTRGSGEVIELECGITVYPAREEHGRWRAVWYENGDRRQCEAASEAKLAARLEKVAERLEADAPNMSRPGADLIAHYLDSGRLPAGRQWSRKHAHTQRRLYERFAAPVIDAVTCQDITVGHMQQTVNAAPTPGEGNRVQGMISALVSAGLEGGYRANPWLARVHWQAGDRPLPRPGSASLATQRCGSTLPRFSPTRTSPSSAERCTGRHGERDELMAVTAAYSGLRWGELTALSTGQIDQVGRVITVDRKVVEIAGHLYVEAPKNRKMRRTIYPWATPAATRSPPGSPTASSRPALSNGPAPTRSADLSLPDQKALAVLQLQPQRPAARLPGRRMARRARQRHLDMAQPAARVLHHRPVHLEARRHRRVPHGRPCQLPHHLGHVRGNHRRRPGPRPHRYPITTPRQRQRGLARFTPAVIRPTSSW